MLETNTSCALADFVRCTEYHVVEVSRYPPFVQVFWSSESLRYPTPYKPADYHHKASPYSIAKTGRESSGKREDPASNSHHRGANVNTLRTGAA